MVLMQRAHSVVVFSWLVLGCPTSPVFPEPRPTTDDAGEQGSGASSSATNVDPDLDAEMAPTDESGSSTTGTTPWKLSAGDTSRGDDSSSGDGRSGGEETSDASDGADASSGESGASGPGPTPLAFIDTFDRSDSDDLDNGWFERRASAFAITSGEVSFAPSVDSDRVANLALRPNDEPIADLDVSIAFRPITTEVVGTPEVVARVREGTASVLDAYRCLVSTTPTRNSNGDVVPATRNLVLQRVRNGVATTLVFTRITVFPEVGQLYRVRLGVRQSDPVLLSCAMDRWNEDRWVAAIPPMNELDDDPQQVREAGVTGFSADRTDEPPGFVFDDFSYQRDPDPVP